MRLQIYIGDEGPTDLDLKDGDVFMVHPDSWIPGARELQRFLCIQLPEYGGDQVELVRPEYGPGPTPEQNVIVKARKYQVRYWERYGPTDLAVIRDKAQTFPLDLTTFDDLFLIVRK